MKFFQQFYLFSMTVSFATVTSQTVTPTTNVLVTTIKVYNVKYVKAKISYAKIQKIMANPKCVLRVKSALLSNPDTMAISITIECVKNTNPEQTVKSPTKNL